MLGGQRFTAVGESRKKAVLGPWQRKLLVELSRCSGAGDTFQSPSDTGLGTFLPSFEIRASGCGEAAAVNLEYPPYLLGVTPTVGTSSGSKMAKKNSSS